jgi:low temperature requirement protein LtrA
MSPLLARDREEEHRSSTQLELFFDLVIVVAIAAAAHGLRHEIVAGHAQAGIIKFLMAFFCVWWPWNLFTWFATSFDNDDAAYRFKVMAIMVGAMFVAASMPGFFEFQTLTYTYIGYVIMRLASAALWIRAGFDNPQFRITATRYSLGQILLQILWGVVAFALEPGEPLFYSIFTLGVVLELFVPWYAERAGNTHWHRHHIIERFGLLNIIVLGEVLLSSTGALEAGFTHGFNAPLITIAVSGILIAFSMWWLYFSEVDQLASTEVKEVFIWGYGHFLIFAAGAAVGAGLGVAIDGVAGGGHGHDQGATVASLAIALPLALYIFGLWLVRDRLLLRAAHGGLLLLFATLIAISGFLPFAPISTAVLLVICVVVRLRSEKR